MNLELPCGVLIIPNNLISKDTAIQKSRFDDYNHFCKVFGIKPSIETLQVFLKYEKGGK